MADDADDTTGSRPSLEAPRLSGWRRAASPGRRSEPTGDADIDTRTDDAEDPPVRRRRPRPTVPTLPRLPRLPRPSGRVAAATAGLLVGLSLLGLTWLGFRGCEAVRGTSSCGTAPGMAALVVIFVLAVVVGGLLLSWWDVPDPGASSFLGTGLTGVVCLLFLVDHLDSWPVLVAIPVVTAGTFLASWWVTTTYVEPA